MAETEQGTWRGTRTRRQFVQFPVKSGRSLRIALTLLKWSHVLCFCTVIQVEVVSSGSAAPQYHSAARHPETPVNKKQTRSENVTGTWTRRAKCCGVEQQALSHTVMGMVNVELQRGPECVAGMTWTSMLLRFTNCKIQKDSNGSFGSNTDLTDNGLILTSFSVFALLSEHRIPG